MIPNSNSISPFNNPSVYPIPEIVPQQYTAQQPYPHPLHHPQQSYYPAPQQYFTQHLPQPQLQAQIYQQQMTQQALLQQIPYPAPSQQPLQQPAFVQHPQIRQPPPPTHAPRIQQPFNHSTPLPSQTNQPSVQMQQLIAQEQLILQQEQFQLDLFKQQQQLLQQPGLETTQRAILHHMQESLTRFFAEQHRQCEQHQKLLSQERCILVHGDKRGIELLHQLLDIALKKTGLNLKNFAASNDLSITYCSQIHRKLLKSNSFSSPRALEVIQRLQSYFEGPEEEFWARLDLENPKIPPVITLTDEHTESTFVNVLVKLVLWEMNSTQQDLAQSLGTIPQTFSYILRGKQTPNADLQQKLSNLLMPYFKKYYNGTWQDFQNRTGWMDADEPYAQ